MLALFARQAREAVARISGLDAKARTELAHRLAGAAKGVGAFEVARCASEVETRPRNAAAIAAFTRSVIDADAFIAGLMR